MTSSAGWNSQVFRGRIRISRKTSEFGGPGRTFDAGHKKTHFSEFAVFSAFCTKNGVVTKTGDIGKTFSGLKNLAVLQGFLAKIRKLIGDYKPLFLTTPRVAAALHKAQVWQHAVHGLNAVRRAQDGQGEGGVGQPVAPAAHHVHADVRAVLCARGFTTWELVRGSNVVRNLHFVAPLSAALANGDDTLSITADCYSTAGTDAAITAALLAYYTSAQVDALLGAQDAETTSAITAALLAYYTSAQVDALLGDYRTASAQDTQTPKSPRRWWRTAQPQTRTQQRPQASPPRCSATTPSHK